MSFFLWEMNAAAEDHGARKVETLAVVGQYKKFESASWKISRSSSGDGTEHSSGRCDEEKPVAHTDAQQGNFCTAASTWADVTLSPGRQAS